MNSLYHLLHQLLDIYATVIVVRIIAEWLYIFGFLNSSHRLAEAVMRFLIAVTEPSLRLVRRTLGRYIPLQVASIELTPLVVLLGIWFIQSLMAEYWRYLL